MVTLSVTPSRITAVLNRTADLLEAEGWDPHLKSVMQAIDQVAGFVKPGIDPVAEESTLQAWDALVTHLDGQLVTPWECSSGRTQVEVLAAVRGAAKAVRA